MLSLGYVRESEQSASAVARYLTRHRHHPIHTPIRAGLTPVTHSLIFFYMLVSLNVAINSYDYTLLSLLISNQFVEIKGCE